MKHSLVSVTMVLGLLGLAGCATTAAPAGPGLTDAQKERCAAEGGCGYISAKALTNMLAGAYLEGLAAGRALSRGSGL